MKQVEAVFFLKLLFSVNAGHFNGTALLLYFGDLPVLLYDRTAATEERK